MSEDGIIKMGEREITLFSQGDVFCSLTPEELEVERQEAREQYEKYEELVLLEKASKMSLMDFFVQWMGYLSYPDEESEWRIKFNRRRVEEAESWESYRYRMSTYDDQKATEKKLRLWRKIHMIEDNGFLVVLAIIAYLLWNNPENQVWSYVAIILIMFNLVGVLYKWSTFFSKNKWEVS